MDDERLILEVQNHSIIYETSHPFYKDNSKKEKAWDEIGKVLGVDASACKSRWRMLRDNFVKHKKKTDVPSGSAGGTQKDWKYAQLMSFLHPHLQPRSSRSNLRPAPSPACEVDIERPASPSLQRSITSPGPSISRPSTSTTPSSVQSTSTPATVDTSGRSRSPRERAQPPQNTGRRRTTPQNISFEDRLLHILQEPPPRPTVPEGEKEEMYYFALSLVPILLRLSKEGQTRAKFDVLRTLQRIEAEEQGTTAASQTQQQTRWEPMNPAPRIGPRIAVESTFQSTAQRTLTLPPQIRPIGPYTEMLAQTHSQWEETTGEEYFSDI